jgi:hypothetical protein
MTNKTQVAAAAKALGKKTFLWKCKENHGLSDHYTSNAKCAACSSEQAAARNARRVLTPEERKARNTHAREYQRVLRSTSANYRGTGRENRAARAYIDATSGTEHLRKLPASYEEERDALRKFYAAMPEGYHGDHLCPKVAKDLQGAHVASGLHSLVNLRPVPGALNRMKMSHFDPDNFRDQRPANPLPGGAWDPELTEQEWSLVELLVRRYGEDRDTAVKSIQAQIALQHEEFCARVPSNSPRASI